MTQSKRRRRRRTTSVSDRIAAARTRGDNTVEFDSDEAGDVIDATLRLLEREADNQHKQVDDAAVRLRAVKSFPPPPQTSGYFVDGKLVLAPDGVVEKAG